MTEHRARETDYREMVDGSANRLCIHRHYVLQFANRTMARMFGYDRPADLVGVDIRTLIPGHRAPTPAANSGAARPGTRRQQVEGVKRDGQRVRVTALVAAVTWRARAATIVTLVPVEHPVSG
ncbi:MAG: PAS domain-containing protein [Candidatus Rokubacteria bacterium]|nr:PAS domain-containing protein [Candidatus Rokubacteria bacterium]